MGKVYLVRHGQASFGADNYDKLSDVGHQQALWLGEYFRERNQAFDAVWCGDMVRHQETAQGICRGGDYHHEFSVHTGLNEFNFQSVANAFISVNPSQAVTANAPREAYYRLLRQAMLAWAAGELDTQGIDETWDHFKHRVTDALIAIQQQKGTQLVVSSGGAMAMMMGLMLDYPAASVINVNLQIRNASFAELFVNRERAQLGSFNNIPHLDQPSRQHAITYS